jgi:hypothetical protein
MTLISSALALTLATSAAVGGTQQPPPQDPKPAAALTGTWIMSMEIENMGPATVELAFKQEGEKITGTYTGRYGTFPLEGALKERAIEFTVLLRTDAGDSYMYFAGEMAEDGKSLWGTGEIEGLGGVSWSAKPKPKTDGGR